MADFGNVKEAPADPIFGLALAYKMDTFEKKVDLGVGAYRTEEGKPLVLNVVREAERRMLDDLSLNKEYLPIDGDADFRRLTARLLLGPLVDTVPVATCQALSGTGALRLGAEFIKRNCPNVTKIYVSSPTWGNHHQIFQHAGLEVATYPYWHAASRGFDFDGMLAVLRSAPAGSCFVLHLCAHNPTGVDPTLEQWEAIADIMKERQLLPFFDAAYQGFASGDVDRDAQSIRLFVAKKSLECMCAQSYAKNFGLYAERIGALNVVCRTPAQATAVSSQLKVIVRAGYSNPPCHGARIVATVLKDSQLAAAWDVELKGMAGRIIKMRSELRAALEQRKTAGSWEHITSQIGMFSFTGLTPAQCEQMVQKHHVYMLSNGRISMAGLSARNVAYVADAIHDVVTNVH